MKYDILILIYNRLVGSQSIIPQARKIAGCVHTKPSGGFSLKRETGIDIFREDGKPVFRMIWCAVGRFINISAALEARMLKDFLRCLLSENIYTHPAAFLDDISRALISKLLIYSESTFCRSNINRACCFFR